MAAGHTSLPPPPPYLPVGNRDDFSSGRLKTRPEPHTVLFFDAMHRIACLAVAAPVAPAMVIGAEAAEALHDAWRMRKGRAGGEGWELKEVDFSTGGRAVWLWQPSGASPDDGDSSDGDP